MANLFIDPIVMASPQYGCSKDVFEEYISQLLQWQDLSDCAWSKIFFSSKTIDVLFSEHRYPIWDEVEKIINGFGIDYIQPKDIVVLVDSFLQKFIKIEEWLSLEEFVYENILLAPNFTSPSDPFRSVLGETLILMVLKSHIENESQDLQLLITDKQLDKVQVRSTVLLTHFSNGTTLPVEFEVDGSFKCCSEFDELLIKINYPYLWANCESKKGLERLVYLFSSAKKIGLGVANDLNQFEFGLHFIATTTDLQFKNERTKCERLLRAMSDLILDLNLGSTHALRAGAGGNNPQIESNGFKAWRKDIDYEYHLHYWKSGTQIIFANVVTHNDFEIN